MAVLARSQTLCRIGQPVGAANGPGHGPVANGTEPRERRIWAVLGSERPAFYSAPPSTGSRLRCRSGKKGPGVDRTHQLTRGRRWSDGETERLGQTRGNFFEIEHAEFAVLRSISHGHHGLLSRDGPSPGAMIRRVWLRTQPSSHPTGVLSFCLCWRRMRSDGGCSKRPVIAPKPGRRCGLLQAPQPARSTFSSAIPGRRLSIQIQVKFPTATQLPSHSAYKYPNPSSQRDTPAQASQHRSIHPTAASIANHANDQQLTAPTCCARRVYLPAHHPSVDPTDQPTTHRRSPTQWTNNYTANSLSGWHSRRRHSTNYHQNCGPRCRAPPRAAARARAWRPP